MNFWYHYVVHLSYDSEMLETTLLCKKLKKWSKSACRSDIKKKIVYIRFFRKVIGMFFEEEYDSPNPSILPPTSF